MNLRKFIAPNLAILVVLSVFWFAGIDPVKKPKNDHKINIQKYAQVQRKILDNYVDKVNLDKLYEQSLKGFVAHLKDSTANIKNTPLDTTFSSLHLKGFREAVSKFNNAYQYMAQHFPNANMDKHTVGAIRGMLNMLDPHSIYIKAQESQQIAQRFRGKFQGIGIYFTIPQDTITVTSTIAGGPSDKVGLQSEDRIVDINDSNAVGFSIQDVRNALLGPKGTKVNVTVKRPHVNHLLHFTITRAEIPIYTIDTSYMLNNKTGYIEINRFAATTHKEFMQAVHKLQKKGMKRLMIDLRGNPGGYMSQAIKLASEFFPKGTKIVSTKSRHLRYTDTYYSRDAGSLQHIPLIVLVNRGTASASEIFSGSIQDHDRGIIVGQRTFGKGLVQQQYGLVDSSKIRVTIARYYTPSGRLIQKPVAGGKPQYAWKIRPKSAVKDVKQYLSNIPDSLVYHTDAGRVVYGGGGIVPDHIVQEDTSSVGRLINYIQAKEIGLQFANDYLTEHGKKQFSAKWKNNYNGFRKNFHFEPSAFDKVLKMLQKNDVNVSDTLSKPYMFKSDKFYMTRDYYKKAQKKIGGVLKADIARDIWGQKKYYPIINDTFNHTIKAAMKFWNQAKNFAEGKVSLKDQNRFVVNNDKNKKHHK
ncbi:MAG TPA: S41 family peptidase [Balneolaceae bacterium]|nr:S41 family peptidase [Balneolaceae bacterium]